MQLMYILKKNSMKNSIISLLLLVGLFSACGTTENAETEMVAVPWIDLFNKQNLDSWQKLNGEAEYRIENDEIVGITQFGTPNTFLTTKKMYSDFIFEFEVKVDSTVNSGVQFRSNSNEEYNNGRVHGYQCEIDPSARAWSGGIYDEARRGWLYDLEENDSGSKAFVNNEWNQYRIEAIGDTIRIWVNEVNTSNLVDTLTANGFIGLQVHGIGSEDHAGKEIRWRNLRIITEKPSNYKWLDKVSASLKVNVPGQYPIEPKVD